MYLHKNWEYWWYGLVNTFEAFLWLSRLRALLRNKDHPLIFQGLLDVTQLQGQNFTIIVNTVKVCNFVSWIIGFHQDGWMTLFDAMCVLVCCPLLLPQMWIPVKEGLERAILYFTRNRIQVTLLCGPVTQHALENIFPTIRYRRIERWLTFYGLEVKLVNDITTGPIGSTWSKSCGHRMISYAGPYVC